MFYNRIRSDIMKEKILFDHYTINESEYEKIKDLLISENDLPMVISLHQLQFSPEEIRQFLNCSLSCQRALLEKQRKFLLKKAHDYYQLIDKLDDMIYKIKENSNE